MSVSQGLVFFPPWFQSTPRRESPQGSRTVPLLNMAKRVQVRQIRSSSMNGEVSVMYKVIIVGNSGVGKTCLALTFGDGAFPDTTETTIGVDFKEKSVKVDSEIVRVSEIA